MEEAKQDLSRVWIAEPKILRWIRPESFDGAGSGTFSRRDAKLMVESGSGHFVPDIVTPYCGV